MIQRRNNLEKRMVYCEICQKNIGTKEEPKCSLHTDLAKVGGFCSDGEYDETKQDYRIIFSPKRARKLLKKGFSIIDIKANKDNPLKTVFVFKQDEEFIKALKDIEENEGNNDEG